MPGWPDHVGSSPTGGGDAPATPPIRTDEDPQVIGFFGATPTTKPSVRAAATTNAQAIALANDTRAALIALGLVQ